MSREQKDELNKKAHDRRAEKKKMWSRKQAW
jgi:hypothetical protein